MRYTLGFDENPANSPQNVWDVLDARFDFEHKRVPIPLSSVIELLGVEVEDGGGLTAIKSCVEEFDSRKGERSPELKSLIPTLTQFQDYLFSPISNFAKVIQGPEHPGTSQVAIIGAAGLTVDAALPKTLKVKIYTGVGWDTDFPLLDEGSPPDLFVKLGIQGRHVDESTKRTRVEKNTWTPSWGEEFEFRLRSLENASILFEVYDRDRFSRNDFAGFVSLPVSELRTGIRAVPLHDREGNQCVAARLLVRFMIV